MTTSLPPGVDDAPPWAPLDGLHDAVVEKEHEMTTHFAVIEGWLGLMEDGTLEDAQGNRAAQVVRQRTEALRLDLGALLRMVKEWTGSPVEPGAWISPRRLDASDANESHC